MSATASTATTSRPAFFTWTAILEFMPTGNTGTSFRALQCVSPGRVCKPVVREHGARPYVELAS
jgi:hypothetical protein